MYIWDMFGAPNIDNFGDKYVDELMSIKDIG